MEKQRFRNISTHFDLDGATWTEGADADAARIYTCGVNVDGTQIALVGGADMIYQPLDTISIYNTETDTWSALDSTLPQPLGGMACVFDGEDSIYPRFPI